MGEGAESLPGGVGNRVREMEPSVRRVFSDGRGRGVSCGVSKAQFKEAIVDSLGSVASSDDVQVVVGEEHLQHHHAEPLNLFWQAKLPSVFQQHEVS